MNPLFSLFDIEELLVSRTFGELSLVSFRFVITAKGLTPLKLKLFGSKSSMIQSESKWKCRIGCVYIPVLNESKVKNTKIIYRVNIVGVEDLLGVVGQVLLEVLAHAEGLDPLIAEDWLHGVVGSEVLLVVRVLEVVLLEVGPEPLDHLRPGDLLSLLGTDDGGEVLGHVQLHVDASLLWFGHFVLKLFWNRKLYNKQSGERLQATTHAVN